jgi:outer membrane protein assembly factor BamB
MYYAQQDFLAPKHLLETNNEYNVIWDISNISVIDDTSGHPRIVGDSGKIIANGAKQGWFSNGTIFGIDSNNGKIVWEVSEDSGGDMLVQNGTLYFGTVGTANLRSYNIKNGEIIWSTPMFWGHSVSDINYADNKIFVVSSNDTFFILNDQGKILDTSYITYRTFLISGGVLYRQDNFSMTAIEFSSKKELWTVDIGERFTHAPIFNDGEIFLRTWSIPTNIYSIDQYVGKVNWVTTQDTISNLCIIGDKIYFMNRDGYLVAINRYSSLETSRVKFSPDFDLHKQISSYSVACDAANNVLAITFGDNTEIMGLKILNP